ncbi:hypothetical protein [Nocardioides sp. Leaf285]|uniref:hypothetical protein n=1 Tax=Nocardioides sp. Leaf285 TaxID=1736322 RepID=UPI000703B462|nr:hypothetical protein [Nocardioides sp. Leaf285]KQP63130.1 hypothetical protein ASF47_19160 [Nocardioides sp. Leaf285]
MTKPSQPNSCEAATAREAARRSNGEFGTQAREEASADLGLDLLATVRADAERLHREAVAHEALAWRLEAYEVLKDLPEDHRVHTTTWPEEPNGDGTFDVDLGDVLDAEGERVGDLGGQGAVPAGWFTGDEMLPARTAYDVWRIDSYDPESPISIATMKAWHRDLSTNRAREAAGETQARRDAARERFEALTTPGPRRRRMAATYADWQEAEKARTEAVTPVAYTDLAVDDHFLAGPAGDQREYRVRAASESFTDRAGATKRFIDIVDSGTGSSRLLAFSGDDVALRVPPPAGLHVEESHRPTERDLNEGWGV